MKDQIIHLHRSAPAKPAEGQPCNGCGVCCALETCPAARLRFLQKAGPCPALEWSVVETRYHCGLLTRLESATLAEKSMAQKLIMEHEMGELFKVIGFAKGGFDDAIGFAQGDRTHTL